MGTNYKHLSCEERTMIQLSLERGRTLWEHVERLLRRRHSPGQITGILRRMQPDAPTPQASHETIYAALSAMPRGEWRSGLIACLRARDEDRRGTIPNMVSIHMRPPETEECVIPGHWGDDLIKGTRNAPAVGTLVEPTTPLVALARIDSATAAAVTGFGTDLNRNDLIAPHFPKGTDLSGFTQAELAAGAWQLNTRPRKSRDWTCPANLLMPEPFDVFRHHRQPVALRN